MTDKEGIEALEIIIGASISNTEKQDELKAELLRIYKDQGVIAAKGILAECQRLGDKEVSEEIGKLIKDVAFNFV